MNNKNIQKLKRFRYLDIEGGTSFKKEAWEKFGPKPFKYLALEYKRTKKEIKQANKKSKKEENVFERFRIYENRYRNYYREGLAYPGNMNFTPDGRTVSIFSEYNPTFRKQKIIDFKKEIRDLNKKRLKYWMHMFIPIISFISYILAALFQFGLLAFILFGCSVFWFLMFIVFYKKFNFTELKQKKRQLQQYIELEKNDLNNRAFPSFYEGHF